MPHLGQIMPPSLIEKREGEERHATMRLAQIILPDDEVIQCVIRDLSLSGAKLGVSQRFVLPKYFKLSIAGRTLAYPVQSIWRRGDFAGVKLLSASEGKEA